MGYYITLLTSCCRDTKTIDLNVVDNTGYQFENFPPLKSFLQSEIRKTRQS